MNKVYLHDLGREKFLQQAWDWKEEYATFIRQQWAKLGLGLDYSRERFTLDDGLSKAVRKVFVDLYNKVLFIVKELLTGTLKLEQLYQILKSFMKMSKVLLSF